MAQKISTIISLQNFESGVDELFASLNTALGDKEHEVIFVDDGSTDTTFAKLTDIADNNENVQVIKMRAAFGEASALDAGLKQASGDSILYLATRVGINVAKVGDLITKFEEGYDLVVGWRYPRRDSGLNQTTSKWFNSLTCKLSNLELHDISSGVFVIKRQVLDSINIYGDMNHFVPVLAARQGYKIAEQQIEQLPGTFRQSKYVGDYLNRFLDILTVFFLTNYSKKPIHFLGFVGAIFTLLGAGIDIYLFFYRLLGIGPIAGRPMLLLGTLLLVLGIQMISIGLIGEMIIFTHARDIKEYNIEKVLD